VPTVFAAAESFITKIELAAGILAACHCAAADLIFRSLATPVARERYNRHSAGSMGWPFPLLKFEYIFQIKYTEAILSNSTRKLLRFEITKILIAV